MKQTLEGLTLFSFTVLISSLTFLGLLGVEPTHTPQPQQTIANLKQ
jgi:hypothetical protein